MVVNMYEWGCPKSYVGQTDQQYPWVKGREFRKKACHRAYSTPALPQCLPCPGLTWEAIL